MAARDVHAPTARAPRPARGPLALFTRHPASVGETYGEHLRQAASFGGPMILAGLACLVHGLFPFLFARTGSDAIRRLHARLENCPKRGLACREEEAA